VPAERARSLRALARGTVAAAVRWSGLTWVARHTYGRRGVAILVYHAPDPDIFERHLDYLSRHYTFASLDAVVDALRSGRWEEIPDRSVVLTIDDGKSEVYALRPMFERYKVVPTLFVCSQLIGTNRQFWFEVDADREALKWIPHEQRLERLQRSAGYSLTKEYPGLAPAALTVEQLIELDGLVSIGSHTRFHPILTTCSDELSREEITQSRREIEDVTGRSCAHFCPPNGSYSERELAFVRDSGYLSARTTDPGWVRPTTDPYQLPVLGIDDTASVTRLAAAMAGAGFAGLLARSAIGRRRHRAASRSGTAGAAAPRSLDAPHQSGT